MNAFLCLWLGALIAQPTSSEAVVETKQEVVLRKGASITELVAEAARTGHLSVVISPEVAAIQSPVERRYSFEASTNWSCWLEDALRDHEVELARRGFVYETRHLRESTPSWPRGDAEVLSLAQVELHPDPSATAYVVFTPTNVDAAQKFVQASGEEQANEDLVACAVDSKRYVIAGRVDHLKNKLLTIRAFAEIGESIAPTTRPDPPAESSERLLIQFDEVVGTPFADFVDLLARVGPCKVSAEPKVIDCSRIRSIGQLRLTRPELCRFAEDIAYSVGFALIDRGTGVEIVLGDRAHIDEARIVTRKHLRELRLRRIQVRAIVELQNVQLSRATELFTEWFHDTRITHQSAPDAPQRIELIGPAATIATAVEVLEKIDALESR